MGVYGVAKMEQRGKMGMERWRLMLDVVFAVANSMMVLIQLRVGWVARQYYYSY